MAIQEHFEVLKQGITVWNKWREQNPNTLPDFSYVALSGADLHKADLREADFSKAILSGANLQKADLRGANLNGADLSEANLHKADLSKAILGYADLSGADLSGANLQKADLREAKLRRTKLRGAKLSRADLSKADLCEADLSKADLSKATLNEATLNKAILGEATLININLRKAHLNEADLHQADLFGGYLSWADFSDANLSNATLFGAYLRETNLSRANLSGADLSRANFFWPDFRAAFMPGSWPLDELTKTYPWYKPTEVPSGANLSGANLSKANLSGADLSKANLNGADLSEANLSWANLSGANLNKANLTGCFVYAASVWDVQMEETIQTNLVITTSTDLEEPFITVDNLEIAQFIYLLLNNKKIRDIIDTITSKVVLILGRFTPERKTILDALRNELRKCDYLPILFDFDKPSRRNFTETVRTLAHLARFIIADLTDPSSIPQELQAIIPTLAVPVQPVLLEGKREYAMFVDFLSTYHWVLPIHYYTDQANLLATLKKLVIEPAEQKAQELERR